MKLKTLEQFESKDPCECGGNCGCGGKTVNEKFSFSKKEVEKAANLIASAIAQADMVKTKVHHLEYDKGRGAGFDISIDGEESAGGSYVVKDNGDVVNAAIGNSHPNAVYNTIGNKSIADVFINMEKYESLTTESFDSEELYNEIKKDRKTEMVSDIEDGSILFYHKDVAKGKAEVNVDGWSGDITIEVPGGPYGSGEWYGDQVSNMKDIDKQIKSYIKAEKSGEFENMEESAVTEAKSKFKIGDRVSILSKSSKKPFDSGEVTGIQKDGTILINGLETISHEVAIDAELVVKESVVTEAKKYKFKELAKAWEFVYGEEMEDEYEGFYQEVVGKYKNKVTKEDIAEIWNKVYGEDIATEYDGFFGSIKENLNTALKLDKLFEANADGTISDDEDDAVENMLVDVEYMVDELVNYIKVETKKIGGSFRSPGMEAQCLKLVKETFKKHKVRL